jgi:Domain of unknown function (DUF4156)
MKALSLLALVLLASSASAAEVTVTKNIADVQGCAVVAQVKSTWGHWGLTTGYSQVKERAAALGADTVLITSSKATDWLVSGIAYRCAK